MKIIFTFFFLFSINTYAQILHKDFLVKNINVVQGYYNEALGTSGMRIILDYNYSKSFSSAIPLVPEVVIRKNGLSVYQNKSTIELIKTNKWERLYYFIPYRAIDMLGGEQEVTIEFKLPDLFAYKQTINYNQPVRYAIEIDLKAGQVKRTLRQYDKSLNAKEWLPDPFFEITTNKGATPVHLSKVDFNNYSISPQKFNFYVLKGEKVIWRFYDHDGAKKQLLGVYEGLDAEGEFKDEVFGAMFSRIRNLNFIYTQKELNYQPVTIHSDGELVHKDRKGVVILVEYDLAKAYQNETALPQLKLYNKDGYALELKYYEAMENTPVVGTKLNLAQKGVLKYFIPYYAWDGLTKEIRFEFLTEDQQVIYSAKHIIRKPIDFGKVIHYAGMKVEEEFTYKGARGVRLGLNYKVSDLHLTSRLEVTFTEEDGSNLPFNLYHIKNNQATEIKGYPYRIANPKDEDFLYFFIPYHELTENTILAKLDIVPDYKINLVNQKTPLLIRTPHHTDVDFRLVKSNPGFLDDNYGQVVDLVIKTPEFFHDKCKMDLIVRSNEKKFINYCLRGDFQKNEEFNYIISDDSIYVQVSIPHRLITPSSKIDITAQISDFNDILMSSTVVWKWEAPVELWNRTVDFDIKAIKFEKEITKDTALSNDFPWTYRIEVGSDRLVDLPLGQKLNVQERKALSQKLFLNREDNIYAYLLNNKSNQKINIWKGDLGKLGQNDFKIILKDKFPIQKLIFKANTDLKVEAESTTSKPKGKL